MKKILVVTNRTEEARRLQNSLRPGYRITETRDIASALIALKNRRSDILFIDLDILRIGNPGLHFKSSFQEFWALYPSLEIIVLCHPDHLREAVKAVRAGANTYLTLPVDPEEARLVLESLFDYKRMELELDYFRRKSWHSGDMDIVQTRCANMHEVFEKIQSVAPTGSTVLLTGETGTGKSVLASLIHRHSTRRKAPFISLHCGAIPDALLESELFGHEKGAFTGAERRRLGKFEIASGGTVFLDEVGTISASAQIKLLQLLQEKTFQRLGGDETFEADVRVIAATNSDLRAMCDERLFRKDLYYRLNVFPIKIPPLRDRIDDIPILVQSMINKMNRTQQRRIRDVHVSVMQAFKRYAWPGNIRELENLMERASILETGTVLSPDSFPSELFDGQGMNIEQPMDEGLSLAEMRKQGMEQLERRYLEQLLLKHEGRIQSSAAAAGITTRRLHALLQKYDIRKERFKNRIGH